MKILLTGPRGNLGQALMRQGRNHEWLMLDREAWGDLPTLLPQADVVIHAASDLLTPIASHPSAVMDTNVMTLVRLLEAWPTDVPPPAHAAKKTRFVLASSCAVYGSNQVTDEDEACTPLSLNGLTKAINERTLTEVAAARGMDFQILRLFNTFGGQDRFSILSHLRRALSEKQPFTMNNDGISQRDFIHVEDIAFITLELLRQPVRHRVMNVGSGETTRISEIVENVRAKHPTLQVTNHSRPEAEYSRADIRRLRQTFPNYKFRKVLDFVRDEF